MQCNEDLCGKMVSYKEEIIKDQVVFGLRCKDTQAKILALGKGLPSLEAVILRAEAEELAKMTQDKLSKGMRQEVNAEVSAVETDKAKLGGIPRKGVNIATGQVMGGVLISKQEKSWARLMVRTVTSVKNLDI